MGSGRSAHFDLDQIYVRVETARTLMQGLIVASGPPKTPDPCPPHPVRGSS